MIKILFFIILFSNLLYSNNNFKRNLLLPDSMTHNGEIKDMWLSRDKGLHLTGSFISTGLMIMSTNRFFDLNKQKSMKIGVSFTVSLSLGKEFYDSQQINNHFSYKDLTADVLGIILAVLVFK